MESSKHVTLVKGAGNRWDLVSPKGHVIIGDILLYSRTEAEAWVKNYISSYLGWSYEIVDKTKDVK
jgi:hypothetical protein